MRRRREEEERIAQQNDFLRASLRGSHRLQALQDGPMYIDRPSGVDNDAFTDDEEVEKIIGKVQIKKKNKKNSHLFPGYPEITELNKCYLKEFMNRIEYVLVQLFFVYYFDIG